MTTCRTYTPTSISAIRSWRRWRSSAGAGDRLRIGTDRLRGDRNRRAGTADGGCRGDSHEPESAARETTVGNRPGAAAGDCLIRSRIGRGGRDFLLRECEVRAEAGACEGGGIAGCRGGGDRGGGILAARNQDERGGIWPGGQAAG